MQQEGNFRTNIRACTLRANCKHLERNAHRKDIDLQSLGEGADVANAPFTLETCFRKMVRICLAQTPVKSPAPKARGWRRKAKEPRAARRKNYLSAHLAADSFTFPTQKMNRYFGLRPMTSLNNIEQWVSPLFKISYRSYKQFLKNNVQNTYF